MFYFSFQKANDEAMSHVGIDTIQSQIMRMTNVNTFHPTVIGYTSPYQTVVSVATAHHKL